jgi:hypothetical protein
MKAEKLTIVLALVNLALVLHILAGPRATMAEGVAPVLRGRALEIVDDEGRRRATITVQPAGTLPNGQPYPGTVMLRLIDANGRPEVKMGASEAGGDLGFVGEFDQTQVLLKADGAASSLKLTNQDGREQVVKP